MADTKTTPLNVSNVLDGHLHDGALLWPKWRSLVVVYQLSRNKQKQLCDIWQLSGNTAWCVS